MKLKIFCFVTLYMLLYFEIANLYEVNASLVTDYYVITTHNE